MFCKVFLLFISGYFLTACAVLIPVHQAGSSQALKKEALKAALIIGSAPKFGSTNSEIRELEQKEDAKSQIFAYQLAYGLTNAVDLEFERLSGGFFGANSIKIFGLKYQYLGLPEYSAYSINHLWSGSVRARFFFREQYFRAV